MRFEDHMLACGQKDEIFSFYLFIFILNNIIYIYIYLSLQPMLREVKKELSFLFTFV